MGSLVHEDKFCDGEGVRDKSNVKTICNRKQYHFMVKNRGICNESALTYSLRLLCALCVKPNKKISRKAAKYSKGA